MKTAKDLKQIAQDINSGHPELKTMLAHLEYAAKQGRRRVDFAKCIDSKLVDALEALGYQVFTTSGSISYYGKSAPYTSITF